MSEAEHAEAPTVLEFNTGRQHQDHELPALAAPIFPQETFDHIIDHLHDDVDTLRKCALVCRSWASSTSYHLFYYLCWPLCPHSLIPARLLKKKELNVEERCPYGRKHEPAVLLTLLSTMRSPRCYNNIRDLHIHFATVFPFMERLEIPTERDFAAPPIEAWATVQELLALVAFLPQLRSLELSVLRIRELSQSDLVAPLCPKRSLTALTIDSTISRTPQASHFNIFSIAYFMRQFARIHTLTFRSTPPDPRGLPPEPATQPPDDSPLPRVEVLAFASCALPAISAVLPVLQRTLDVTALTTLTLEGPRSSRFYSTAVDLGLEMTMPAFLRVANNLNTLICDPYFYPYLHEFIPPTLRELHLHGTQSVIVGNGSEEIAQMITGPRPSTDWPSIFDIPPTLFTPDLHTIFINFYFDYFPTHEWSFTLSSTEPSLEPFEMEAKRLLEGYDWAPFARLAERVELCTLRLVVKLEEQHAKDERSMGRCMEAMEEIARRRIPESVRGNVRLEVSNLILTHRPLW